MEIATKATRREIFMFMLERLTPAERVGFCGPPVFGSPCSWRDGRRFGVWVRASVRAVFWARRS